MPKVVVNSCYGGFSISKKAAEYMAGRGHELAKATLIEDTKRWYGYLQGLDRADPLLVAAVEALGEEANGSCAKLQITDVPDGVEWEIEQYDGREWVAEKRRTW